jgi:uncharacterized protein YbjT (DUF2867 family)
MSSPILIAGATGDTGRATTRELLAKGLQVRALVHKNDDRSRQLEAQGAEIFVGDLLDLRLIRSAFEGVKRAYFVYPPGPGLVEATAIFAQAAKEAQAEFIVNMSQIAAQPDAVSNLSISHWLSERIFDSMGTPVTHIRPTVFYGWILFSAKMIAEDGRLGVPFGPTGKFAPVAVEDLGALIATILVDPSNHLGKSYPIVGPIEFTPPEVAEVLSKVLGRKIRYEQISAGELIQSFAGQNIPFLEQHFNAAGKAHHAGILGGADDFIEKTIGRRPESLSEFIERNRALLGSK